MFLNPASKSAWMKKYWTEEEQELTMRNLKAAMLAYAKAEREEEERQTSSSLQTREGTPKHQQDVNRHAGSNLAAGIQGLQDIFNSLDDDANTGSATSNPAEPSENTSSRFSEEQDALDRHRVEAEVLRYVAEPVPAADVTTFDILSWWQANRFAYPLLWKVARDVLPAQASSVPCERVFSASKQTTTQQRNCLSPGLVEKLQILKFGLKQDRLDFTADWVRRPEEMFGGMDFLDD